MCDPSWQWPCRLTVDGMLKSSYSLTLPLIRCKRILTVQSILRWSWTVDRTLESNYSLTIPLIRCKRHLNQWSVLGVTLSEWRDVKILEPTLSLYWAIQAGLLTPLTFARHRLCPLAAFTSGAYFLHNGKRWHWICEYYTANFKGILEARSHNVSGNKQ